MYVEQIDCFCCLGSIIAHDNYCEDEIHKRIATANRIFAFLNKNVWNLNSVSITAKTRLHTALIGYTLLCTCDT